MAICNNVADILAFMSRHMLTFATYYVDFYDGYVAISRQVCLPFCSINDHFLNQIISTQEAYICKYYHMFIAHFLQLYFRRV